MKTTLFCLLLSVCCLTAQSQKNVKLVYDENIDFTEQTSFIIGFEFDTKKGEIKQRGKYFNKSGYLGRFNLVVIGGKEYGTGSSRDWAAKGTKLLGIKAVIAESFERIHRSNLIGMGILPLQFTNDVNRKNLKLVGSELISIINIEKGVNPSDEVTVEIKYASGEIKKIKTLCRIDTKNELEYYKNGGILQYVLRNMI